MAVTKCTRLRGVIVGAVTVATRSKRAIYSFDTYTVFVINILDLVFVSKKKRNYTAISFSSLKIFCKHGINSILT